MSEDNAPVLSDETSTRPDGPSGPFGPNDRFRGRYGHEPGRGPMFPGAVGTLALGGVFLGAAVLQKRVSFIPKNPLVLIGAIYTMVGAGQVICCCGAMQERKRQLKEMGISPPGPKQTV